MQPKSEIYKHFRRFTEMMQCISCFYFPDEDVSHIITTTEIKMIIMFGLIQNS